MPRATRSRKVSPSVIDKEQLAREIRRVLREEGLTQTSASYLIRDAPSQLSLINMGRLRGFSAERLLMMLTRLGRDVEIRIRPATRKVGRVRVVGK